jgi:hypothetical protein
VQRCRGYTTVESLVVIAIIMVMLSIALPHYAKVIRLAKQVSADEAKHQRNIGSVADGGGYTAMRETARFCFRQMADTGRFDTAISQMLYVVTNDGEFEAYWNTLINPANDAPLEYDGDRLLAEDFSGREYVLKPIVDSRGDFVAGNYPIEWDFLSTNMADMTVGNRGITAQYLNHQEYIPYPGAFPCTAKVAELSRRYMIEVWPTL